MITIYYILLIVSLFAVLRDIKVKRKRAYKIPDSIDIQCEIMPVAFNELSSMSEGESSASIRDRVVKARMVQTERFRDCPEVFCNAQMGSRLLKKHCLLDEPSMRRLRQAMERFDMSARAYDRILKVARTIADLQNAETLPDPSDPSFGEAVARAAAAPIEAIHVAEAISYRNLDRASWGSTLPKSL